MSWRGRIEPGPVGSACRTSRAHEHGENFAWSAPSPTYTSNLGRGKLSPLSTNRLRDSPPFEQPGGAVLELNFPKPPTAGKIAELLTPLEGNRLQLGRETAHKCPPKHARLGMFLLAIEGALHTVPERRWKC